MAMKVGILGTGNIAPAYIKGCGEFPDDIRIVACADLIDEKARAFAEAVGIEPLSIQGLLNNHEIDLVINLTVPTAHAEVSRQIIDAGKHVYVEKPLALRREEGRALLEAAAGRGVRVGCAPDTFLGAGGQTARMVIDRGDIGEPVAAVSFMGYHGPESFHPNPAFFYQYGGGPMFDMGPYYLTTLVNLVGPFESISAMAKRSFETRTAQHESIRGQEVPVGVDTHIAGTALFANGVVASIITSFDLWSHHLPRIEIYGSKGSMLVPNPNIFGGDVQVWSLDQPEWQVVGPVGRSDLERGVGVADMARAIANQEPHRASGELAYHVLDVMQAFEESAESGELVRLSSHAERPPALA
ncbi:MAG: Gfo/Idh/MocA family oxidoreductase [Anaerolineales bacterium]|nr:Gfo/Idh/MocA family oxidoreductase [Anaerolineales bacterium]